MNNAFLKVKTPINEPILSYKPGSEEKDRIKEKLHELQNKVIEIPLIIDGKEVYTGNTKTCIIPHKKDHIIAKYHIAGEKEINMAIESSLNTKNKWQALPWEERVAVFLKAAELLSGPWRDIINASTMLCQSKTVFQAEIDSACELIDFFRFNAYYITEIYSDQPNSTTLEWNRLEYRPLEGFVFAVTPFNFTSIGGNLPTAPAMVGNVVVWKPASTAVYSNYFVMKLLQEAGLPDGVINFVPGPGSEVGNVIFNNENLSGIHFTGSTKVFKSMWRTISNNLDLYKTYPKIVGETGGKDFIFAHSTCDIDALTIALVRGAFEYQGQKCSAASRAYIPSSIWNEVNEKLNKTMRTVKMGDVEDFTNFVSAVIDKNSFDKIKSYIEYAKSSEEAEVIIGGNCDDSIGYFIEPTIILAKNPKFRTMEEEIFGPVLTIYVYEDKEFEETLKICNETSPYGLTGAIFSKEREIILKMREYLYQAAGNFYINDKPTGAVVGMQPFGGGRASGTNDKAGSKLNLLRWLSPMTIKENFNPPKDYRYPFMNEK